MFFDRSMSNHQSGVVEPTIFITETATLKRTSSQQQSAKKMVTGFSFFSHTHVAPCCDQYPNFTNIPESPSSHKTLMRLFHVETEPKQAHHHQMAPDRENSEKLHELSPSPTNCKITFQHHLLLPFKSTKVIWKTSPFYSTLNIDFMWDGRRSWRHVYFLLSSLDWV